MEYYVYHADVNPLRPPKIPIYNLFKMVPVLPTWEEYGTLSKEALRYRPIPPKIISKSLVEARKKAIRLINRNNPIDYSIWDSEFNHLGTISYNDVEGLRWYTISKGHKSKLYGHKIQKLHTDGTVIKGSTRYYR